MTTGPGPVAIDRIRGLLEPIAREAALRLLVLFGSTARAEERPRDLDIAALGAEPLDTVALTNRLIRTLEKQDVDLVDLRRADPLLMMLVARDGISVYEAEPGEFARFVSLAARRYADTRKFREMERCEIRDFVGQIGAQL